MSGLTPSFLWQQNHLTSQLTLLKKRTFYRRFSPLKQQHHLKQRKKTVEYKLQIFIGCAFFSPGNLKRKVFLSLSDVDSR